MRGLSGLAEGWDERKERDGSTRALHSSWDVSEPWRESLEHFCPEYCSGVWGISTRGRICAQIRDLKKEIKSCRCSPGGRGEIGILDQSCQDLRQQNHGCSHSIVRNYSLLLLTVGFGLKPYTFWNSAHCWPGHMMWKRF